MGRDKVPGDRREGEKDLEGKDKKANVQGGVLDLQKNRRVWLENGVRDPFYKLG